MKRKISQRQSTARIFKFFITKDNQVKNNEFANEWMFVKEVTAYKIGLREIDDSSVR